MSFFGGTARQKGASSALMMTKGRRRLHGRRWFGILLFQRKSLIALPLFMTVMLLHVQYYFPQSPNENYGVPVVDAGLPQRVEQNKTDVSTTTTTRHRVAGLSCKAFGGPPDEQAAEMVYWRDIPDDAAYVAPFYSSGPSVKYLTFEPDEGGFNNIRMAMETAVALAISMGRTLVLPPEQPLYLLHAGKRAFSFADFYHVDSVVAEHKAAGSSLDIIAFEEFLRREAMTGNLLDKDSGQVSFPPGNRTNWGNVLGFNWEGGNEGEGANLWGWMRQVTTPLNWSNFDDRDCIALFPKRPGPDSTKELVKAFARILEADGPNFDKRSKRINSFTTDGPTPVNASAYNRLREMMGIEDQYCLYDEDLQKAKALHIKMDAETGTRLLVHFYAFLFYEDWHQDLWMKRFVRDKLRYVDEIQCAAARIVVKLRQISRKLGNSNGEFDTFHIRRGDFALYDGRLSAEEIYQKNTRLWLKENSVVYVATDEGNRTFFDPLKEHYNLYFLRDFRRLLKGVDRNYYGMVDQLVASRGDAFCGSYYSTFTSYINRIRGYHSQKHGARDGIINSYNIHPDKNSVYRVAYKEYKSLLEPYFAREFPVAWRDIDHDAHPVD